MDPQSLLTELHKRPSNPIISRPSQSIITGVGRATSAPVFKINQEISGPPIQTHWKSDEEASNCGLCGLEFNWISRKHHCRKCGSIFCGSCSNYYVRLDQAALLHRNGSNLSYLGTESRVCRICMEQAGIRSQSNTVKSVESTKSSRESLVGSSSLAGLFHEFTKSLFPHRQSQCSCLELPYNRYRLIGPGVLFRLIYIRFFTHFFERNFNPNPNPRSMESRRIL